MGEPVILTKSHITQPQAIDSEKLQVKSADIGNMLATGQVESQNETALNTTPVQNPTMVHQLSTENFHGYSIEDLRKYLKPICNNVYELPPNSVIDLVNENLNKAIESYQNSKFYSDECMQFLKEIFPDKDGLERAIIEAYFDVDEVFCAIDNLKNCGKALSKDDLHYSYRLRCYGCVNNEGNVIDDDEKLNDLIQRIIDKKIPLEEKKEAIERYILYTLRMSDSKDVTYVRDAIFTIIAKTEDSEVREFILDLVSNYVTSDEAKSTQEEDDLKNIQVQLVSALLESFNNIDEQIQLIGKIPLEAKFKNPQLFRFVADQFIQKDGRIYQYLRNDFTDSEIDILNNAISGKTVDEDALLSIIERIDNKLKAIQPIWEDQNIAFAFLDANGELSEEDRNKNTSINTGMGRLVGEDGLRELWTNIHKKIEQNPEWFQGIDQEQFNEIMNRISNGNYQIVVEDILRGDGVQTPLNMPEVSGNGNQNNGSGVYNSGSAQNPETGFFNVQPQSLLYNSQNNLAQLRQQIQDATHQNNTPQLVKPNQSIDNAIALGINLNKVVQQNIKENGVTGFVKEVLNSNIAMKCTYVRDKALNCFDSMGTGLRRLTFECIHKTSSAIVAARRMSSDELDNVQAQNIYVAQNIERIEEERKKQEDKV